MTKFESLTSMGQSKTRSSEYTRIKNNRSMTGRDGRVEKKMQENEREEGREEKSMR